MMESRLAMRHLFRQSSDGVDLDHSGLGRWGDFRGHGGYVQAGRAPQ